MNYNRCFHCGNKLIPSTADMKISYEELVVEVQDAPCEKCSYCSRISFGDEVYGTVERFMETMKPKTLHGDHETQRDQRNGHELLREHRKGDRRGPVSRCDPEPETMKKGAADSGTFFA